MTTASQLSIYQGACLAIGERQLQTLTEDRPTRHALDDVWTRGGVRTCLSHGLWNFAGRGIQWNFDSTLVPAFGFTCVFQVPTDWVRWMMVCQDPYFSVPLLQYTDENSTFYCDLQQLWVKYVSDDLKFGMNLAFWPDNFQRYVEAYFGAEIAQRVTGDTKKTDEAIKKRDAALKRAKSTDALNEASAMIPPGNWRQARHGRRQSIERGNRNSFLG